MFQKYIVGLALRFFQQIQMGTCTTDVSFVAVGDGCCLVLDMDAIQLKLLFQIVVVMNGNPFIAVPRKQR